VEAQTELQNYLDQGKQELAQGHPLPAATAYAYGAQIEPENPQVHLGLAEANLSLGKYGIVQAACRRVQELDEPTGVAARTAQALLDLVEHRYDRALKIVDDVINDDPSTGYNYALRSYLLRAMGQDYDANLARAKAARMSFGGRYEGIFPPLETNNVVSASRIVPPPVQQQPTPQRDTRASEQRQEQTFRPAPNRLQRQAIRTRFALSQYPGILTYILIALCVLVYVVMEITGGQNSFIFLAGVQYNPFLTTEPWRILTAMFIHDPASLSDPTAIFHLLLNMLSLFFIGRVVEIFYGRWRYLVIYLLSGIFGGIFFYFTSPGGAAVGASGAIFGVFGALGVFYLLNRRALGSYGNAAIGNWVFWLLLNLVFGFSSGGTIAIWDHIGGIIAGIIIAYLLFPRARRGRIFV
jgi:membrane associated rhomboid family serine protease